MCGSCSNHGGCGLCGRFFFDLFWWWTNVEAATLLKIIGGCLFICISPGKAWEVFIGHMEVSWNGGSPNHIKSPHVSICFNMFQWSSMTWIWDIWGTPMTSETSILKRLKRRFHRDPLRSLSFQVFLKHPIRPGSRKQWWPASLACWWSLLVTWCRIGCCYIPLRAVIICNHM